MGNLPLRVPRMRLTVFRLMLVVAISAIAFYLISDRFGSRRERLLEIANRHSRLGAEYRHNAGGSAGMLSIAAWHDHMRSEFERAAARPWAPSPSSHAFPPKGWQPRAAEESP